MAVAVTVAACSLPLAGYSASLALSERALKVLHSLRQPLLQLSIASPYGMRFDPVFKRRIFHEGVDYAAAPGTPVYAAQTGLVVVMRPIRGYGFYVRMRHAAGVETAYGHLTRFMPGLHAGSMLRCGDVIGFVGATGAATGPHLHFEILVNGRPIDPEAGSPRLVATCHPQPDRVDAAYVAAYGFSPLHH
ncbi:MAG: M23 family metallopeptidase [Sinobacteraceae bacterium]|nr:M23 family metallopeptidase [Nevskiaceae bacterium]